MKALKFMDAFAAGCTVSRSSNYDGAPPVPPAYGACRRVVPARYEARYLFFTTQPPTEWRDIAVGGGWHPTGHSELRETIERADDARSFTATLALALFDIAGRPVEGGGSATGRGSRVGL